MMEMHGVIPLPPEKSVTSRVAPSVSTKWPAGGTTMSSEPSRTCSFIQLEMRPPSTRLTVTLSRASMSGELDSE